MTGDAPFFVVGMGRSGTTLLRLMLHHHPRLAIPYESSFITGYYERLSEFGDLGDDRNWRRLIESLLAEPMIQMWDHQFALEPLLAYSGERSLAGAIDAIYTQYAAAKGKPRWGDKSDYLDRLHQLNAMFPTAKFIHIIRDGRDVALSVLKLPWGPRDVVQAAEWWNDHVWVARRVGSVLGPARYMEVRYEDLVENPERELRRCCAFLGEEYSPAMLAYGNAPKDAIPKERQYQHKGLDKPPNTSRSYAWKREMNRYDLALFNRHASRMLRELGYELPQSTVSKTGIGLRYLALLFRRFRSSPPPRHIQARP